MKRDVMIWHDRISIDVSRKSKAVWVADGYYKGKLITVTDSTEGAAIIRWREAAQYQGNL